MLYPNILNIKWANDHYTELKYWQHSKIWFQVLIFASCTADRVFSAAVIASFLALGYQYTTNNNVFNVLNVHVGDRNYNIKTNFGQWLNKTWFYVMYDLRIQLTYLLCLNSGIKVPLTILVSVKSLSLNILYLTFRPLENLALSTFALMISI